MSCAFCEVFDTQFMPLTVNAICANATRFIRVLVCCGASRKFLYKRLLREMARSCKVSDRTDYKLSCMSVQKEIITIAYDNFYEKHKSGASEYNEDDAVVRH